MGTHSETCLNRKFIEFAKLLNIYANHFPKCERYSFSNRLRNTAYEAYDLITESQKRYYKKSTLTNLDIAHEKLRMQLYLAYELGYFQFRDGKQIDVKPKKLEERRFLIISKLNDEMGKMIGGWIKKIKEENRW